LSVGDVLCAASEPGLTLTASTTGDTLKVYPAENITPELAAAIRAHKAHLIRILREDEEMRRTGIIQSERQVFELARESFRTDVKGARHEALIRCTAARRGSAERGEHDVQAHDSGADERLSGGGVHS
jgi:hypothetical protein